MSDHFYEYTVESAMVDALGHVNNAKVLTILENARWSLVTPAGFGPDQIQKHRHAPIILEIHIRYQQEMLLGNQIRVATRLLSYTKKIGKLSQVIYVEGREGSAVDAVLTFGLFDLDQRKLISPTPEWNRAIGNKS